MGKITNVFFKNSSVALMSQFMSLASGMVLSLILPKYISIESFGYWQLFLLYVSYVGVLDFGFSDGLYLKVGGQKFESLNYKQLSPQIFYVIILQLSIGVLFCIYACFFIQEINKKIIFYFVALYLLIENTYKIFGFICMATDKIIIYSKTVIKDKLLVTCLVVFVLFGLLPKLEYTIITCFIFSHLVALFLLASNFRHFFSAMNLKPLKENLILVFSNMKYGLPLTFSNVLSILILGSGRLFVEKYWDITSFAKISFSLTISMFVLSFISQIGLVLFPIIRNIDFTKQKIVYQNFNYIITVVVLISFIFFPLIYYIIEWWIPKYQDCLPYLIVLCPLSLYEIRFSLIYATYLKNLNKQKTLLLINIISVSIAIFFYSLASYYHNLDLIVYGMLIAIMIRSILSEIVISSIYKVTYFIAILGNLFVTFVFLYSFIRGGLSGMFFCSLLIVLLYTFLTKNKLKENINFCRVSIKNRA